MLSCFLVCGSLVLPVLEIVSGQYTRDWCCFKLSALTLKSYFFEQRMMQIFSCLVVSGCVESGDGDGLRSIHSRVL